MSKSAEAFRTISEVAEVLDTPAHVLRFWESRFSQIKPVKRAGGRRYYRPSDIALLGGIRRLLHEDGLTIRGVQKILREKGVRHVASLSGSAFDEAAESPAPAPRPVPQPPSHTTITMPFAPAAAPDLFSTGPDGGRTPWENERDDPAEAPMEVDAPTLPRETAEGATPFGSAVRPQPVSPPGPDAAPSPGADAPAAALLRAMDAVRAQTHRSEFERLHDRLAALRDRVAGRR